MYLKFYFSIIAVIAILVLAASFLYTGFYIGKKVNNHKQTASIILYILSGINIIAIALIIIYTFRNVKIPGNERMYCADCGCYRKIETEIFNDMPDIRDYTVELDNNSDCEDQIIDDTDNDNNIMNLLLVRYCSKCGGTHLYNSKEDYEAGFKGKMKNISDDAPTGITSIYDK